MSEDQTADKDAEDWAAEVPAVEEPPKLRYPSLPEFVEAQIARLYIRSHERSSREYSWCDEWFKHPEVVARFSALWRAFESLRQDPGLGPSVYWIQHLDPHMREILSPAGPFSRCEVGKHSDLLCDQMPLVAPPDGMFPRFD